MINVFDTENPESGFRLMILELFNWGTFDKNVWRIRPEGKSSLLTGGNGSGKTTIADAILTLLVPYTKRHYNQSSGTDKKRDRSEETYVRGAFKTVQHEGDLSAKTEYLRTSDDFSVILGLFFNRDMNEFLTLAQVRWFSNNQLKRWYIISPEQLNIQTHFNPFDPDGKWKKRLIQSYRAEFFSSFQQYAHRFSNIFGLKSRKALNLFSQTVGIKVLGNLNEFIRTNMLEEHQIEQDFTKLRENYDNLLSSHKAIEKAKAQSELLEPIIERGDRFESISREIRASESAKEAVLPYFASEKNRLLSRAIEAGNETLQHVHADIQTIGASLYELDQEKEELVIAVSNDSVSEQIRYIEREITRLKQDRDTRQSHAEKYNAIARRLNLPRDPDETLFRETAHEISLEKSSCSEASESLLREKSELENRLRELKTRFEDVRQDLKSLRERPSNIPRRNLEIRRRITEALNFRESEVPFVGELVRVKETEQVWESAIERLMRNFGLNLLVSEACYSTFNHYVNHTHLYGRIVYHRVPHQIAPDISAPDDPRSLITKLELRSDSFFYHWLERHIRKYFNYICTEDIKDFERLGKALTPSGLVKNFGRHEKDDRTRTGDKANYIFGWDNTEKVRLIERQARSLHSEIQEAENELGQNTTERQSLERKKEDLAELARYDRFSLLDWKSPATEIEGLKTRKQNLLQTSDRFKELEDQLGQVKKRIKEKQNEKEKLSREQYLIEEKIRQYTKELDETSELLSKYNESELKARFELLEPYIRNTSMPIRLETLNFVRESVTSDIARDLKYKQDESAHLGKELIRDMVAFKHGNEELREKYPDWTAETINLEPDPSYLNEYRAFFDRIRTEDLPRHKERFKHFMNKQMADDIISFKAAFDHRVMEIKENINEINESLKEIDYNIRPSTYIRLIEKDETDVRIRDFKDRLRKAIPDAVKLANEDEQELESAFGNIKALIEKMNEEQLWREYVTDVRNWLKFAAEERYREDDTQKQYYEDSQSLSGGEKAKLAYTILASAIAYQFGIRKQRLNLKSFRFVVVDEAFSKVDPENSVYAMELFKQLNLQLMLVTPLDKINLAEKYIHAVHYVENKYQRDSRIYDLTMEEYQRKKERFRASVTQEQQPKE